MVRRTQERANLRSGRMSEEQRMVGWDTQRIQTPNLLFWTNWREIHTTQFATMLLTIPALVPTLSNGCIRAKESPTINT